MISLYEQLAAVTEDEKPKAVLMEVANEEKTHFGESSKPYYLKEGAEQVKELEKGKTEVEENTR